MNDGVCNCLTAFRVHVRVHYIYPKKEISSNSPKDERKAI